jgi:hypothetical protein
MADWPICRGEKRAGGRRGLSGGRARGRGASHVISAVKLTRWLSEIVVNEVWQNWATPTPIRESGQDSGFPRADRKPWVRFLGESV